MLHAAPIKKISLRLTNATLQMKTKAARLRTAHKRAAWYHKTDTQTVGKNMRERCKNR